MSVNSEQIETHNQDLIASWVESLEDRDLSPRTVKEYLARVTRFARGRGRLDEVTPIEIRAYVREQKAKQSKRALANALRSFYSFLKKRGLVSFIPNDEIHLATVRQGLPKDLERGDARKMLEMATWIGAAHETFCCLIMYQGLRSAEARHLRWDDLEMPNWLFVKNGKGGKDRKMGLHPRTVQALERLAELGTSGWVLKAVKDPERPLCEGTCQGWVRRWAQEAHVSGSVHPHRFRHTFATGLLRSGVDIVHVSKLLGHTNIKTTMIYTAVRPEDTAVSLKKLII